MSAPSSDESQSSGEVSPPVATCQRLLGQEEFDLVK
jgi:hypothetical protein